MLARMVSFQGKEVGELLESRGGRMLRVGCVICVECSEAPVFVGFWFGRHVDAGRRRLYSLPCVSISVCLYSCIASDGRVDGWLGVMRFDERYLVT
jgi:hypothetical protein